ncbi:uncharacterized protein A1O5_02836 [Cladophialophora psammophila CBS 110553]|uniref:Uncharacterized protein n=1 Tax=Cladophialophora psammophila CBS 110553 TaxID=1182543 RepID=W9XB41_9EURO|nr:uncharacterized protein A1O5_02836 [Cladophialophora psammophila CBS 110553]EXJ74540.1 hypothetical protein A1O5_02836 [Cladophialophora psammophila CBS 110553]
MEPKEREVDCAAAVFERLRRTCFKHQDTWKKWLPYCGVTKVEEVHTFDKIREELDDDIARDPRPIKCGYGIDDVCDTMRHCKRCKSVMRYIGDTSTRIRNEALERISEARRRKKALYMVDILTKCARSPWEAKFNGPRLLEGVATDCLIYELE